MFPDTRLEESFDTLPLPPVALHPMPIPTEPIGSIPRPPELVEAMGKVAAGAMSQQDIKALYDRAIRDTIKRFEATGSPIISDGEQTKPSFATYPIQGLEALAPDGITIPFADGHTRQLPRLTAGPFRPLKHRTPVKMPAALNERYPWQDLSRSLIPLDGSIRPGHPLFVSVRDVYGSAAERVAPFDD